jgi:hypothetical protein
MMLTRRSVTLGSAAVATATLALGPEALAAPRRRRPAVSAEGGQAVLDWVRVSFTTVYGPPGTTPPLTPVPVGVPVLGFVSLAMYRAANRSAHLGNSSESAAVARAAHDVLLAYYPGQAVALQAALDTTFDAIGPGHVRAKGSRIGADAAREMIESREGDHFLDSSIHYSKAPGPGVWQPASPNTDMLAAWLGSLRPLFVAPVPATGPYTLGSAAWAADFDEVKRFGGVAPTERTQAQTDTAVFFDSNAATMVPDALARYLQANPIGIQAAARVFATIYASMTDSIINCWKLKRDIGFWRPFEAIGGPYTDGNPATLEQAGWTPLRPKPNYSDYVSGHGSLTGSAVEVIRRTFREDIPLELRSGNFPNNPRIYALLTELEADAFMARIWGGFHYRKAMTDAYDIAHRTADRVVCAIDE